ncbi:hypothetical protein CROQUDRAFT_662569, partial [Cronartium quercuum f. sp. fusiforme G11]
GCGLVVDWSEKLREAGSVDYSEKNPRINFKNPVESRKTGSISSTSFYVHLSGLNP